MNNNIHNWMELPLSKLLTKYDSGDWGNNPENQNEGTITIRSTDFDELGRVVYDKSIRRVFKKEIIHKKQLLQGDILLNKSSGSNYHIGKVILFKTNKKEQHHFSNFIQRLRVNTNTIINKYLCYYLRSIYGQNEMKKYIQTASGLKNINMKSYYCQKIPVPPLVEQRGIVEVLGTVDECIRLTDVVIERAKELKRGLMQRLLTRGIGHKEYIETPFGEIPKTWKIRKISELVTFKNGIYKPTEFYGSGFPSIRMYNIVDEKIVRAGAPLLAVTEKELEKFGLSPGDLLINRVNTIDLVGKIGIVDKNLGPATFESKNIRLRIKNNLLLPDFLNFILNTKRKQYEIRKNAKAAIGQATITQNDLEKMLIPIPSLAEQENVVKMISTVKDEISINQRKNNNLNILKQGLMQVLLSGKIRVELKEDGLHRIGDGREANN